MGDRLERIEHELYCIEEAIDFLREVRGSEDIIDMLLDKTKVLTVEKESVIRREIDEAQRETRAMEREYFRAVM